MKRDRMAPSPSRIQPVKTVQADAFSHALRGWGGSVPTRRVEPVNNVFTRYSLHGRMRYRPLPLKRPLGGVNGDDARFD